MRVKIQSLYNFFFISFYYLFDFRVFVIHLHCRFLVYFILFRYFPVKYFDYFFIQTFRLKGLLFFTYFLNYLFACIILLILLNLL